ncbi:hypothetical protein TNCV_1380381 [Trichonephila clavipes]|nr:hypothetical protein TNCV_1380381 [Trichonephila clavipes]
MIPAYNRRGVLLSTQDGNPLQTKVRLLFRKRYNHALLRIRTHSVTIRGSYPPYLMGDNKNHRTTYELSQPTGDIYETEHVSDISVYTTHAKLWLPTWRVTSNFGDCCDNT